MGGRAGGGASGGMGKGSRSGGFGGFPSADSVFKKAFSDNTFRVGVSKFENGVFKLTTTNAPLNGGGKQVVQTFHGGEKEIMSMANGLKAGKTLNEVFDHRFD